ncbi:ZIP family metal transporter [Thermoactinomyces sp. DSM 45892]|uniref:ZIP family metal transporter n=1 Tax=Thermoactinomyces sp. DSM 45892 TaxID=1882753 RepID=UPI000894EAAC|nr:ZIP family metal transporter [Thermoactinomyces sp. DSM 45892]SDY50249.1 Zinc transporter ZupT [Thermoactinomyces sp. DSM 45892]
MSASKKWLLGLLPVVLLALMIVGLFSGVDRLIPRANIPLEEISFDRVWAVEGKLLAKVTNTGADPVTIAQVTVNDAMWNAEVSKSELGRFDQADITIPFHWVEGEPYAVTVVTSTGAKFTGEISAAMEVSQATPGTFGLFALIGLFVGVIPVLLGMLWKPFVAKLDGKGYTFVLAVTIGLLIFLGIDSLNEAFELADQIPGAFQGVGIILLGGLGSFLILSAISSYTEARQETSSNNYRTKLTVAYLIALGIGIHNLGEGLAIGAAFTLGNVAMGAFLIMGFTLHNITEGLAIVVPVAREKIKGSNLFSHLLLLGAIGGVPAIIGTWIGGFVYSPIWSLIFLSIGAGAIFQVVVQVFRLERSESNRATFLTPVGVAGLLTGIVVMYITALFVTA